MTPTIVSTIFDEPHYVEARLNRMANFLAHVDARHIIGKRVLELGCGAGDFGEDLVRRGATVVSVDAVEEHLAALKAQYPDRHVRQIDLETLDPREFEGFDAVFCFGLLYHLATPTTFLRSCAMIADELWLETMVQDRIDPVCEIVTEQGPDQSFSGFGCRPSRSWLNQALNRAGFNSVRDISSARANWGEPCPSIYDWSPRNDGAWMRDGAFLRTMLIAKREESAALPT